MIEAAVVALASRLPPTIQRLLAGGRPVRVDGLELAPDASSRSSCSGSRDTAASTP